MLPVSSISTLRLTIGHKPSHVQLTTLCLQYYASRAFACGGPLSLWNVGRVCGTRLGCVVERHAITGLGECGCIHRVSYLFSKDLRRRGTAHTVEPPNNGHIGSRPFVRCREVSLSGRLTHNLDLPLRTLYRLLLKHFSGHTNLA